MSSQAIQTRQQFIDHLFFLMDDFDGSGDSWMSQDIYTFLQAMAAWLKDCEGYYRNAGQTAQVDSASWQLFADALSPARTYE